MRLGLSSTWSLLRLDPAAADRAPAVGAVRGRGNGSLLVLLAKGFYWLIVGSLLLSAAVLA